MKKVYLKLFENSAMYSKTKVKEKIIQLREERDLLARFVIILKTRPEIDLKQAIGTYEFCAVPRLLCSPDGLLLAYDKFKVMHAIEAFLTTSSPFTIVSGTEAKSNKASLYENLKEHNHEEADTLIILHCTDISQKFPESHLDVFHQIQMFSCYWFTGIPASAK